MKILVVDNGTSYLPQLKNILSRYDFSVIRYSDIENTAADDFNAIILSGGHDFPVNGNGERLKNEIAFINTTSKPILGICFGFEVIAYTFGATLELMQTKEKGILDIQAVEPDEIFSDIPNFNVYESHRWILKEPGNDLIVLARSKDGIEAIKHKSKPIYGVQFHPEMFVEKTCGDEIFHNFLKQVETYSGLQGIVPANQ